MTDSANEFPGVNKVDREAIFRFVALLDEGQNDPSVVIPLHEAEAVVVNFPGRRVMGSKALSKAMSAALNSSLTAVRTRVEVLDIRFITTEVALVSCRKSVYDDREDAERLPSAHGSLTYVLKRHRDSWRVALAQTTPVLG